MHSDRTPPSNMSGAAEPVDERTRLVPHHPTAKATPQGRHLAHARADAGRGRRARAEDGVWATLLAMAAAFLLAAVLGVPSPLEPVAELIVRLTPVAIATVLIGTLGGFARAFALLGALACTLPFGIALALLAPSEISALHDNEEPAAETAPTGLLSPTPPTRAGDENPSSMAHHASPSLRSASAAVSSPLFRVFRVLRGSSRPSRSPFPSPRPPRASASSAFPVALRWLALAALAVVVALPLALAANYPGEAAAALALGACYAPALWLVRWLRARWRRQIANAVGHRSSRRAFVCAVASGAVRVAAFAALSSYDRWSGAVGDALGRGETPRRLFTFAPPAPRAPGFPVPGEEPEVTPIAAFYRMSKDDVDPWIAPDAWTLRLDGAVARPLTLRYDELLALPRTNEYVTLRCVSNPVAGHLMSTAYFSGVPLVRLLAEAGLRPDSSAVMLRAPDGYDEPLPLAVALDPRTLAAYGMNGETLARAHGGPVRALIPGYYGFKNVKWLTGVTVLSRPASGFWERAGWDAASVHSVARIDVIRRLPGGELLVAGVAYAGTRGVSAVQVRVGGDGPWQATSLNIPALSSMTWVQWRATLTLAPGTHTLAARVVAGGGQPQDPHAEGIFPGGARGLDTITVTI